MSFSFLGRWEWLLLELLLLGFLIFELVSVNRSIRRDRERDAGAGTDRSSTRPD